jgi:hypothetical protein
MFRFKIRGHLFVIKNMHQSQEVTTWDIKSFHLLSHILPTQSLFKVLPRALLIKCNFLHLNLQSLLIFWFLSNSCLKIKKKKKTDRNAKRVKIDAYVFKGT